MAFRKRESSHRRLRHLYFRDHEKARPTVEIALSHSASTSSGEPSAHATVPPIPISACDLSAESDKRRPRYRPCRSGSNLRPPQFPPFHLRRYLLLQGKHYPVS